MFCENCGKKASNDSKFCEYCGEKFTSEIISAPKEIDDNYNKLSKQKIYQIDSLISEAKNTANRMMLGGVGWIIAGIIITGITYTMAEPDGTYFIFWGLSLYGVYCLIKGLYYRIMPQKLIKDVFDESKDGAKKEEKETEDNK